MHIDLTSERWAFLSTERADRRKIRYALVSVLVSAVIFLAAVPFAKTQLGQVPAFIPIYVSVLVLCDVITAALVSGTRMVASESKNRPH